MYIAVNKEDNCILMIGSKLNYQSNGYPIFVDEKLSFPDWMVTIVELSEISDEIEPEKYCYTEEKGFYLNPDWVEPDLTNIYGIPDEVYHAIIDDYTEEIFGGES